MQYRVNVPVLLRIDVTALTPGEARAETECVAAIVVMWALDWLEGVEDARTELDKMRVTPLE